MSMFEDRVPVRIQSEILGPNVMSCIGDWIEMVAMGDLTVKQLKERVTALWWIASKSGAVHCELVINNFESKVLALPNKQVKEIAKKVFEELLAEYK